MAGIDCEENELDAIKRTLLDHAIQLAQLEARLAELEADTVEFENGELWVKAEATNS